MPTNDYFDFIYKANRIGTIRCESLSNSDHCYANCSSITCAAPSLRRLFFKQIKPRTIDGTY